jgi:hypothetical protein
VHRTAQQIPPGLLRAGDDVGDAQLRSILPPVIVSIFRVISSAVQGLLHDFKDLLSDVFVLGVGDRHVVSPSLSEPATIAVSMAIDRPQAIDDAPVGPERSGGWRR